MTGYQIFFTKKYIFIKRRKYVLNDANIRLNIVDKLIAVIHARSVCP